MAWWDDMQVCAALQTENHASTPPLKFFYRPDALPAAQPTASNHWRQLQTKTCNYAMNNSAQSRRYHVPLVIYRSTGTLVFSSNRACDRLHSHSQAQLQGSQQISCNRIHAIIASGIVTCVCPSHTTTAADLFHVGRQLNQQHLDVGTRQHARCGA